LLLWQWVERGFVDVIENGWFRDLVRKFVEMSEIIISVIVVISISSRCSSRVCRGWFTAFIHYRIQRNDTS
jgi:hypothetical protein